MACTARGKQEMLASAVASRVGQADTKGWKDFSSTIEKQIKALVLPKSDARKKAVRSNEQMAGFFQQLKAAKGRNQTKGKL